MYPISEIYCGLPVQIQEEMLTFDRAVSVAWKIEANVIDTYRCPGQ